MNKKSIYLSLKDYSVSGDSFQLLYNTDFDMLETYPQPPLSQLPEYYKSDNYISHTESKRNVFEQAYHLVKKITLKLKTQKIKKYKTTESTLLDIGCGTGSFLESALQQGWQVCGIEPNTSAREIANRKTNNAVYDSDYLASLTANSFNVITLWHVLEHLPNLHDTFKALKSSLKTKGVILIAVPNFKSYDAKYYKAYWAAFDVPRHLWHFSAHAISKLCKLHDLKVIKKSPMYFDAFYVSLLSEKYKSGKMNPLKAFYRALLSNLKATHTKEYSSLIYTITHK